MGVGSSAATTPIPAFPLKGKVFLCLHKIPFWDITLNRTLPTTRFMLVRRYPLVGRSHGGAPRKAG